MNITSKIVLTILLIIMSLFLIIKLLNNNSNSNLNNFSVCPQYNVYRIKGQTKSRGMFNKILVIGGVHGNEPAPAFAIEEFYNKYKKNLIGNVTIIPNVNVEGIKKNTRYLPCKSNVFITYDINRHFKYNQAVNPFQSKLIEIIKKQDFVLDFHEAYDFNRINSNSVGSTFLPGNNYSINSNSSTVINIARKLNDEINLHITNPKKKFQVLTKDSYDIQYTLRDFCEKANIPYILVEITGQENKQPLELRKKQTKIILKKFFKLMNMFVL